VAREPVILNNAEENGNRTGIVKELISLGLKAFTSRHSDTEAVIIG